MCDKNNTSSRPPMLRVYVNEIFIRDFDLHDLALLSTQQCILSTLKTIATQAFLNTGSFPAPVLKHQHGLALSVSSEDEFITAARWARRHNDDILCLRLDLTDCQPSPTPARLESEVRFPSCAKSLCHEIRIDIPAETQIGSPPSLYKSTYKTPRQTQRQTEPQNETQPLLFTRSPEPTSPAEDVTDWIDGCRLVCMLACFLMGVPQFETDE